MLDKLKLERLYRRYNKRKYVLPDPLQCIYRYPDRLDREIAALIASSLAYGRVAQIIKSVEIVLDAMGPSPRSFLLRTPNSSLNRAFTGFRHRFTTGRELIDFLSGIARSVREHGSLNDVFLKALAPSDKNVFAALPGFVRSLKGTEDLLGCSLLPCPGKGSACKRLNLFLRWMVRKDAVDPGGWEGVPADKLIVPLDTHMANIARALGLTKRSAADARMALEITEAFRAIAPNDPVKYDFTLTRFGIRDELNIASLYRELALTRKGGQKKKAGSF